MQWHQHGDELHAEGQYKRMYTVKPDPQGGWRAVGPAKNRKFPSVEDAKRFLDASRMT